MFSKLFKAKDIGNGKGDVFFRRYTILKCRWFAIYLHQFERGDQDRCLHDHPWNFLSIVLRGGYWEEIGLHVPDFFTVDSRPPFVIKKVWRRPGSILWRPAHTAHRITIDPDRKPWSLVFVGRKCREWGFHEPDGWVAWKPGYSPICEAEDPIDKAFRLFADHGNVSSDINRLKLEWPTKSELDMAANVAIFRGQDPNIVNEARIVIENYFKENLK